MDTKTIVADINEAVKFVETLAAAASVVVPGAAIGGVALSTIASVADGLAQGSQDAIDYIANMKALAASTSDPTPEQWASLDKQTDADVNKLEESTKQ